MSEIQVQNLIEALNAGTNFSWTFWAPPPRLLVLRVSKEKRRKLIKYVANKVSFSTTEQAIRVTFFVHPLTNLGSTTLCHKWRLGAAKKAPTEPWRMDLKMQ